MIQRIWTHKKRRFLKKIRLIIWQDGDIKVYLKVYYGKGFDVWGKYTDFYNDGDYVKKKDLLLAFNAFTEED